MFLLRIDILLFWKSQMKASNFIKSKNPLRLRPGVGVGENVSTPTPGKTTDSDRLRLRLRSPACVDLQAERDITLL